MFFGPVRDPNVLVRSVFWIFRSRFFSPVRDPDFGPDFLVNRSAVQIFCQRACIVSMSEFSTNIVPVSAFDLIPILFDLVYFQF